MRTPAEKTVSPECVAMEQALSRMLARVERRRGLPPANVADGEMNKNMAAGLRDAMRLTHAFMAATQAGSAPLYRARKLVALADGMPRFVAMLQGLEGEKNLSPHFSRMLDREYYELRHIIGQMRDTVQADGDRLLAVLPPKPSAADPFTFVATCMFMPFAVAYGVVTGIAQGLDAAQRERAQPPEPENPPKPARHLTLVHSQ